MGTARRLLGALSLMGLWPSLAVAQLAFIQLDPGQTEAAGVSHLALYDLGQGSVRQLTASTDWSSPSWTADGAAVLAVHQGDVYRVAVADGQATRLTKSGDCVAVAAHPAKPAAWYARLIGKGRQRLELWRIDGNGTGAKRTATVLSGAQAGEGFDGVAGLTWQPDGQHVVITLGTPAGFVQLKGYDLKGHEQPVVLPGVKLPVRSRPAYCGQAGRFAVAQGSEGQTPDWCWAVGQASGGAATLVRAGGAAANDEPRDAGACALAPDGQVLVGVEYRFRGEAQGLVPVLCRYDLASGERKVLVERAEQPAWRPGAAK